MRSLPGPALADDISANVALIGAAVVVGAFGSWRLDVIVGAGVATLFLASAARVVRDGLKALCWAQVR
jgi:Co/Zn/Cd efflux system component